MNQPVSIDIHIRTNLRGNLCSIELHEQLHKLPSIPWHSVQSLNIWIVHRTPECVEIHHCQIIHSTDHGITWFRLQGLRTKLIRQATRKCRDKKVNNDLSQCQLVWLPLGDAFCMRRNAAVGGFTL